MPWLTFRERDKLTIRRDWVPFSKESFPVRKLKKFLALPGKEKRLFLHALIWLPFFELGVRTMGLKRMVRFVSGSPNATGSDDSLERIRQDATIIQRAVNHSPVPVRCLARTLYLWRLLQKQGIDTDLCIGVDKAGAAGFDAHAWLEQDGEILNDTATAISRFHVIRFVRDAGSSKARIVEK